ncbi:MAG: hypothetical protein IJX15_05570 [Ruminiclostridium sp.]|nr:hypothetical protein [Ruminiclostridium sp.]
MSFTEKIENAIDKARNKFDEAFPEEKQEEYRVKINNTINELDKKLDTAFDKAKTKIDESLTEEKKTEYKEKADKAMEKADEVFDNLGNKIENFFNGN